MKGTFQFAKIKGIPISVHWSFVFIVIWVFFSAYSRHNGLDWGLLKINSFFVATLFAIVILHELGHALMAQRVNISALKIVLLPMGGVALLENQALSPRKDLLISLAGPAINFALALLFVPVLLSFPDHVASQMLEFLIHPKDPFILVSQLTTFHWFVFLFIFINLTIGLFNLIPALPLDGGRILKALLAFRMDEVSAVTYTVWTGNILSLGIMTLGYWWNNIILIILGIYILLSATGSIKRVKVVTILKNTMVKKLIVPTHDFLEQNGKDPVDENWDFKLDDNYIPATTTVNSAIEIMLKDKLQFLPVVEGDEVCGIISLRIIDDFIRTV